jgi:L-iditol 2-dehydrogenase
VPVADLITHRLRLSELHDAIKLVSSGSAIKVTIQP